MLSALIGSKGQYLVLLCLSIAYFLENFDRYVLSISPIPYIDYASYEYSVLAGPAFTIVYTVGGLCIALLFHSRSISMGVKELSGQKNGATISKLNIVAIATLVFSTSFTATAFALTFWQQCIIRMAMGLTQSVITPFSSSILSDLFPSDSKGAAFAVFNLGTYISFSLSLSLGLFIYDQYGWQAGYILFGIIGFAFAFVLPMLRFALSTSGDGSSGESKGHGIDGAGDGDDLGERSSVQYKILAERDDGAVHSTGVVNPMVLPAVSTVEDEDNAAAVQDSPISLVKTMFATLMNIATRWWKVSGVYTMSLATGIRLGGGYIWAGYTGVFYSSLFIQQSSGGDDTLTLSSSSGCSYSFNSNATSTSTAGVCGADYPYCVGGTCSALSSYPWHNVGMESIQLEEYMAWVPLVGSALGSLIGGLLSDFFIRKVLAAARSGEEDDAEGDGVAGNGIGDDADEEQKAEVKSSLIDSSNFLRDTKSSASRSSQVRNASTAGLCLRASIAGIGNLIAMPIVVYSFFMDFPGCFLVMICSGMVGELYFSQCLAIVTDSTVVPADLVAPSVALFMFIITIIGGNFPLLIPLFESGVGYDQPVTVEFTAANYKDDPSGGVVTMRVQNSDARKLQYSIVYVLAMAYTLAGLLYLIAALQFYWHGNPFRREKKLKNIIR